MDEATYIRRALASNHQILVMMALNFKAILACSFGFWSMAESIFIELISTGKTFFFSYAAPSNSLFAAISSYSCYQQSGKRKHLKLARKNRRRLASAVLLGCPDAPSYLSFLDAEDLAIRKSAKPGAIVDAYNTAIDKLASAGFPHTEAYAVERAGFFQAKLGKYDDASIYFQKALRLYYDTWGSIARHDWLVEQIEIALRSTEAKPEPGPLMHSIVETCVEDIDVS
ncbi:hypothetical protein MHU86_22983 [Fragilaria crotonensis]|nr:hypothetical protein MHU86_22983 [Fragilaria crotonensis]